MAHKIMTLSLNYNTNDKQNAIIYSDYRQNIILTESTQRLS